MREHRHDPVGEIDAVAAPPGLAVERARRADIETDVGDCDDRVPPAPFARRGPDGVVMITRVDGVDRDDRQVAKILAPLAKRQPGDPVRLLHHIVAKLMGQAVLVDRDQAETARGEGIAEDRVDLDGDPGRPAGRFADDEIAGAGSVQVGNRKLAAFALVDGLEPVAVTLFVDNPHQQFGRAGDFLHQVGDMAVAAFLGARENPVVERERRAATLFDHPQAGWRPLPLPSVGHRDRAVLDGDHAKHGDPGNAPRLMKGAAGRGIDQPFVGHVLEQGFEHDLVMPAKPERPRDFPLAGRLIRRRDEVEDLLGGREPGGWRSFRHGVLLRHARWERA